MFIIKFLLVFIHKLHYTKLKDRIRNEIGFSNATLILEFDEI